MEKYANELSEKIRNNDIINYIECDNYINDYLEIEINELIKEICKILKCKEENNIIKFNEKNIRIYLEIIMENWINYRYKIEYM